MQSQVCVCYTNMGSGQKDVYQEVKWENRHFSSVYFFSSRLVCSSMCFLSNSHIFECCLVCIDRFDGDSGRPRTFSSLAHILNRLRHFDDVGRHPPVWNWTVNRRWQKKCDVLSVTLEDRVSTSGFLKPFCLFWVSWLRKYWPAFFRLFIGNVGFFDFN